MQTQQKPKPASSAGTQKPGPRNAAKPWADAYDKARRKAKKKAMCPNCGG